MLQCQVGSDVSFVVVIQSEHPPDTGLGDTEPCHANVEILQQTSLGTELEVVKRELLAVSTVPGALKLGHKLCVNGTEAEAMSSYAMT